MKKRMFWCGEVEEMLSDGWVRPIGSKGSGESVRKSRVIYADEMRRTVSEKKEDKGREFVTFFGVSPTPEADPWEEWIDRMPDFTLHPRDWKDWLRNIPKRP